MAKVLSSLFDNGDGISVQIFDLDESWHGKTFAEVSRYYKEHGHIMVLGVLENMGAEYELKHSVLAEAEIHRLHTDRPAPEGCKINGKECTIFKSTG